MNRSICTRLRLGFDKPKRRTPGRHHVSDPRQARALPAAGPFAFPITARVAALAGLRSAAVADRPDVLTYQTPVWPRRCASVALDCRLFAARCGTIRLGVKLIDVFPRRRFQVSRDGRLSVAGFHGHFPGPLPRQLRASHRDPAGQPQRYRFALPSVNHVFLAGHRIMVQIQSSWFPLYDRNPQSFVPNIFFASIRRTM